MPNKINLHHIKNNFHIEISEIKNVLAIKYGPVVSQGWGPRMRAWFGYLTPDDIYEAVVDKLVTQGCKWIDVGCGRDIFPSNHPLSRILAQRSTFLLGVDPDNNLDENPYVHRGVKCKIDNYVSGDTFDLVTLRMVAEHIEHPEPVLDSLVSLTRGGGKVVVYTVNFYSPASIVSWLLPFGLHHAIKKLLWGTEARDTFPTYYRLNTRVALTEQFEAKGFKTIFFAHLDDCCIFSRFRCFYGIELFIWKILRGIGLNYPETCILAVFENIRKKS